MGQHHVGRLRADDGGEAFAGGPRTPATLPNAVSSARRRRGPIPAMTSSPERKSRIRRAWPLDGHRKSMGLVADLLQQQ